MVNPNSLIEGIKKLTPSREALTTKKIAETPVMTVLFSGNQTATIDLKNPHATAWADMLEHARQAERPVYVDIDPETNVITRLIVPRASKVHEIKVPEKGDVEVKFYTSAAIHYIRRSHPDFKEIVQSLQTAKGDNAMILVTAMVGDKEIIDVRPLPANFGKAKPPGSPPPPMPDPDVTPARALELFNEMAALTCDSCAAASPCIPFKYPSDGCFARAHEMVRLMMAEGETPEKVWIYGGLVVQTSNNPYCHVGWWYHVAPTLNVTQPSGPAVKMVIDPSIFSTPVTVADWKAAQGDPSASIVYTDWHSYWPDGTTDDTFTMTASDLVYYRDELNDQCAAYGPTPYSCPIVKNCFFIVDRNTFGEDEVEAMLHVATPAVVDAALYVVVDGFSPQEELGITAADLSGIPTHMPTLTMSPSATNMTINVTHLDVEYPAYLKRPQRITWTYQVRFTGTADFVNEMNVFGLTATISSMSGTASIYLIKQPNPYEVDGSVSWLSTDLRVFQINAGASRFGAAMGSTATQAPTFIQQVINNMNAGTTGGETFDDISTDYNTSWLQLAQSVSGVNVFNFVVAKVRYRALINPAPNVRVFFRLFAYQSTSVDFDQTTGYRRGGAAGVVIPLLGINGGEVTTIPCFAAQRIDSDTVSMNNQTDPTNVRTINADASGAEKYAYFGAWLDINQTTPQFPLTPSPVDGPYASGRLSIQELVRGEHQCLVAEIAFDPDPILTGATPSTSDKLAQRNLAIVESANPGLLASHRVPHTFDIHLKQAKLQANQIPDELMIDWGNTPVGSVAKITLSSIKAIEILRTATKMYRSHGFVFIDEHTVQCLTGGITYLPLPPEGELNIAGLISVDLPETVKKGQVFTIVVRQVTGTPKSGTAIKRETARTMSLSNFRHIVGSFQITIPVRHKEELLAPEQRLLSVFRWIQNAIPAENRWAPVFKRYVGQIAGRVDALGGDSNAVKPSPKGEWAGPAEVEKPSRCKILATLSAVLLGLFITAIGALTETALAITAPIVFALLVVMGYSWIRICKPEICRVLRAMIAGLVLGAVILAILLLTGVSAAQLKEVLASSVFTTAIAVIIAWLKRCF